MATVKLNTSTLVTLTASYLLTDHLGSVVSKIDDTGTKSDQSFDGAGRHRDPTTWQLASGSGATLTKHGFTDHEHLDNLNLIHMNGRVYDPMIGRFMSVDPMFQAPTNSQSVNPYSYVMNNPLSLVDPSGYCSDTTVTTDASTGGTSVTACQETTSTDIGSHISHQGETTTTTTFNSSGRVVDQSSKGNGAGLGETAEISSGHGNGSTNGATGTTIPNGSNVGGSANQGSESQKQNTPNSGAADSSAGRKLITPCEEVNCGQPAAVTAPKPKDDLPGRALTENEIKAARTVFGGLIDYSKARIINGKFMFTQSSVIPMTPNGKIYWPGDCGDLATCNGGAYIDTFIHEMMHVYQYQHGTDVMLRGGLLQTARFLSLTLYDPYSYTYKEGKPIDSYNIEQQGDIAAAIFEHQLPNIINPGGN